MDQRVVTFGEFVVDLRSREMRKAGDRVRLQEQPFQILAMLLEHPGDIVTRDEIRDRLWPDGTFVDFEHSVNAAIKRLRAALGDAAENPRFVETLHRRGYRFIAAVDPNTRAIASGRAARAELRDRRPRLVVLPFQNLGGPATEDYFSDGLTEEMIAQVGRRCASRIGVLARTSSMLYKNVVRGASDIGEALRADYLVEGSVRRDGDHVRITAQLIETKGETHLWAQSYDRRLEDCLTVQTEVASQIAHALAVELLPVPTIEAAGTLYPAAYQAFLRGRFYWNKAGEHGLVEAVDFYNQALALDPAFGRAYSARARARISMCEYYLAEPHQVLDDVYADATRALELDSADAEALVALAEVHRMRDWDWDRAEAAYRAGLKANPNSESAHRYYGTFLAVRGRAEANAVADRACDLDPLCLVVNTAAASVRYFGGEYEAALDRCRHTLAMDPGFGPARRRLAATLAALGRHDEALEEFELIAPSRLDPVSRAWMAHTLATSGRRAAARAVASSLEHAVDGRAIPPYHLAVVYAGLGDLDAAFELLDRAFDARDPALDTLGVEPMFEPLRGDTRYRALLGRLQISSKILA